VKLLIINGSLGGAGGNTAVMLRRMERELSPHAELRTLHLAAEGSIRAEELLAWCDGIVCATGTYWDSWGSPLQKFLEDLTGTEATALWLGKPAAVLVTMHSVGGKGVLSRLQGVLNTLGCSIPPMSGFVYSLSNQLALETESDFAADFWQLDDLRPVAENLRRATAARIACEAWPVDREDPRRRWISN
jgi:chromate reductase